MDKRFYIVDTSNEIENVVIIENLTMEEAINWIIDNGDIVIHEIKEKNI